MAKKELEWKSFDVMSAAKITAVVMAIFGLIGGIMVAIFGSTAAFYFGAGALGVGFGLLSVIIFPIAMAIQGFVIGAVGAFIYNIVAKYVGGIKVRV